MPQHRRRRSARRDALAMLEQDHVRIVARFDRLVTGEAGRPQEVVRLVAEACEALEMHARLEEDLFYPAVRHEIADRDYLEDGLVEHGAIDALAAELRGMPPGDACFAATARVLLEQLRHHIAKKERRVFPQVRRAGLDLAGLGEQLRNRQAEMLAQRAPASSDAPIIRRARGATVARYPGFAPF